VDKSQHRLLVCITTRICGEWKVVGGQQWYHYRLCTVTAAICRQISPMLKSTGVGHIGAKFGRKGLTDVTHILARSARDTGLSYSKEIVSISSAV